MKRIVQLLARLSNSVDADILWRVVSHLSEIDQRRLLLRLLKGRTETITFRHSDILWTAFAWDGQISWDLFLHGGFQDRAILAVLAWMEGSGRLSCGRDVILDIGANLGTTTIPFARKTGCRVVAIEPVPQNFELLERNIRQNGLSGRVMCIPAAIVGGPGIAQMTLPGWSSGGARVKQPGVSPSFVDHIKASDTIDVAGDTLGNILRANAIAPEQVTLVWCDVQGSEAHVVRSGAVLWRAGAPLYAELDPRLLRMQAELEDFPGLLAEFFDRFVQREELVRDGAAVEFRPISEIPAVLDRLTAEEADTDVLLLPRGYADA